MRGFVEDPEDETMRRHRWQSEFVVRDSGIVVKRIRQVGATDATPTEDTVGSPDRIEFGLDNVAVIREFVLLLLFLAGDLVVNRCARSLKRRSVVSGIGGVDADSQTDPSANRGADRDKPNARATPPGAAAGNPGRGRGMGGAPTNPRAGMTL